MTLVELLERQRDAAVPVLYDRDRPVSFAALADESAAVAAGLAAAGVAAGDRVAIWLPNVPAWLAAFFACARLGAIAVAVNTRFRSHELADILARSGARALLYWPAFDKADFVGVLAGCPAESLQGLAAVVEYAEGDDRGATPRDGGRVRWPAACRHVDYAALAAAAPMTADRSQPQAGCAMFTTSGTTRAPKFVLHDQQTLTGHAREVVRGFDIDGRSTMLLAPPLCGVFGVCCVLAMIAAGRPSAMTPVWDAAAAARAIDRLGITHMNGTDDAIAQLLAQNARTPAFPTLRFAGYAAFNPALEDIVERADARGLAVVGAGGRPAAGRRPAGQRQRPGTRLRPGDAGRAAARLARYKVPARVFVIDAFPVTEGTNATKIQKHRLRDLALQRLG